MTDHGVFGDNRIISCLLRLVGLSLLVLIAATWRLWLPQETFPQVPLLSWATEMPAAADWIALAAIGCGAVGMLVWPHGLPQGVWCGLVCAGFLFAVMLDQHRLQPWAYQLALLSIALTLASERMAIGLCRMLVASIYIYSAISKLDYTFLSSGGMGERFAATLLEVLRLPNDSPAVLSVGSWLIVLGELAVGILLATRWPREEIETETTSKQCSRMAGIIQHVGWVLAIGLHVTLILILGPLGMNHSLAVLLWNAMFIVLVPILFVADCRLSLRRKGVGCFFRLNPAGMSADPQNEKSTRPPRLSTSFATAVIGLAVGLPLVEPFGWCDTWLAWSLYSSRNEQAIVLVTDSSSGEETRVRIDLMSLDRLGVPIYPENRFRVGVALRLIEQDSLDDEITLILLGSANRLSGQRKVSRLQGADAIRAQSERYWLNAHPRQLPR